MASLLLTAFPVSGIALRRTRDADAAITTELEFIVRAPTVELRAAALGLPERTWPTALIP
jgi:hypothetical protein